MKTLITAIILFFSSTVYCQVQNIIDKVTYSSEYAKKSFNYMNDALSEIKKCYSVSTINDIQYYARRAKTAIDDAISYSKKAEYEAYEAKNLANRMNCSNVSINASEAENYFKKAKNEFENAYSKLSTSTYENNIDELNIYLNNAKSYINYSSQHLKKGVDELIETLATLQRCKY
jgi:hypothetical protein